MHLRCAVTAIHLHTFPSAQWEAPRVRPSVWVLFKADAQAVVRTVIPGHFVVAFWLLRTRLL